MMSNNRAGGKMEGWTFLTNHGHVLLCIARDPGIRMKDVAVLVGITERAAQRIVADLADEGYVTREKVGRRNRYEVNMHVPLRHPLSSHADIGKLIRAIGPKS